MANQRDSKTIISDTKDYENTKNKIDSCWADDIIFLTIEIVLPET